MKHGLVRPLIFSRLVRVWMGMPFPSTVQSGENGWSDNSVLLGANSTDLNWLQDRSAKLSCQAYLLSIKIWSCKSIPQRTLLISQGKNTGLLYMYKILLYVVVAFNTFKWTNSTLSQVMSKHRHPGLCSASNSTRVSLNCTALHFFITVIMLQSVHNIYDWWWKWSLSFEQPQAPALLT